MLFNTLNLADVSDISNLGGKGKLREETCEQVARGRACH